MASATAKVFAIPELLEQILISLDDFAKVYELQCVSRGFKDTIAGSVALERLMGLTQHEPPEKEFMFENLNPLLFPFSCLEFGPFEHSYCKPPSDKPVIEANCRPPCEAWESLFNGIASDEVWFEFLLNPDLLSDGSVHELPLGFCVDYDRKDATFRHGSWRSSKISFAPRAVRIFVHVLVPASVSEDKGLGRLSYRDEKHCAGGDMTLGQLVDLLEDVRCRTDDEHLRRSEELGEAFILRE